jgi:hypothetical protein
VVFRWYQRASVVIVVRMAGVQDPRCRYKDHRVAGTQRSAFVVQSDCCSCAPPTLGIRFDLGISRHTSPSARLLHTCSPFRDAQDCDSPRWNVEFVIPERTATREKLHNRRVVRPTHAHNGRLFFMEYSTTRVRFPTRPRRTVR